MRRGESEGVLRISISPDDEEATERLKRHYVYGNTPCGQLVADAIEDGYKRLLKPAIETEFAALSKEKADEEAIHVFAENLRQLLLGAPLGQKRVMGVDPGFRTGCKVVCLDAQGNLLHHEAIFPHPPVNKRTESAIAIQKMIQKYKIEAISIGNGTASRETNDFIKDVYVNRKTFRASTIETNDGRLIHVISARKGVAYVPPKWWTRISTPNNTKYVVCAVLNHHEDGFRYLKSRDDLIMAIGDNLMVIRVHGQTAEDRFDRTNQLFAFNPDLSDRRTYALLRMKPNCPIDVVFSEDEDLIRSFGEELQETDVTENNDL